MGSVGHEEDCELVLGYVGSWEKRSGWERKCRIEQVHQENKWEVLGYKRRRKIPTFLVEEDLEGFDELVGDTLVDTHPRLRKKN